MILGEVTVLVWLTPGPAPPPHLLFEIGRNFDWRSTIGEEVDFVIETGGRLLPIEVRVSARPRLSDARHLLTFRAEYGRKARAGLLLHTGKALQWIAADVLAAPWWYVL